MESRCAPRYWRAVIYVVVGLALLLGLVGGTVQAASAEDVTWKADITVPFTAEQISQPDWQATASQLESGMRSRLAARGVTLSTSRATRLDRGLDYKFSMSGTGGMAQFRGVMFGDAQPIGGLIGGPAVLNLSGDLSAGENIALSLESNPSTGYAWQVQTLDAALVDHSRPDEWISTGEGLGVPARQVIHLSGKGNGRADLVLRYVRPWESELPTRQITLSGPALSQIVDLADPNPTEIAPASTGHEPSAAANAPAALPSSFDWRSQLTAVRNQGSCGSCWAFSTVGAFESDLAIQNKISTNLSEQFLVSCNKNGWSCNGGWFAHDYHIDKLGKNQTAAGAVLESAFPYVAQDTPCNQAYAHSYQLSDWHFVATASGVPSVDQIKNAIYNYGPVSAAVCAGKAWNSYTGGVFSTNECNQPGVGINHAIVLTGWDDATGTWTLRNSWGGNWGDGGYMHIKWGTSKVGYAANYVVGGSGPTPVCYTLTTGVDPAGSGTVSASPAPNCNGTQYAAGTSVKLTANPSPGFGFVNWYGATSATTNPVTIIMDANKSATAKMATVTLIQNPSFEKDGNGDNRPDNWTSTPKFTRSASPVLDGSFSGRLKATDNSGAKTSQAVKGIAGNRSYHFTGAVNIPATSDTFTFIVQFRWRDSSGAVVRTDMAGSYRAATGGWANIDQTYTAPKSARSVVIVLIATNLNATIYVDKFWLE